MSLQKGRSVHSVTNKEKTSRELEPMCKESTVQIVHFGKDWDRVAVQAIVGLFAYCEEMIASPKQSQIPHETFSIPVSSKVSYINRLTHVSRQVVT